MSVTAQTLVLVPEENQNYENNDMELGDLYDCSSPGEREVYRFEYVERPPIEGYYLLSISGLILHKKVEARPGGKVAIVRKREVSSKIEEYRTTIPLDDPSVKFYGNRIVRLIRYNYGGGYFLTNAG